MAEQKTILEKYVNYEENNYWTCRLCQHRCNGRPCRMIAHLTGTQGKGIKICPEITLDQVKELKRKLGLGPHSTGAEGRQLQQPGENDDIGQENGNKKRKGASGSGTGGSNQREAEMSPSIALNPPCAVGEGISVSNGNTHGLQNPEISVEAADLQPGYLEQNSSFSQFGSLWDKDLAATAETTHDRGRAYGPNADNGGFHGTNAVGSSGLSNIIRQAQYFTQGQVDHRNDQHTHPHTSTRRNASGLEMGGENVVADEPQPCCPPGFNPDLWKYYLELETKKSPLFGGKFPLYEECMSSTDEEERKALLRALETACRRAKMPGLWFSRHKEPYEALLYYFKLAKFVSTQDYLKTQAILIGEIERETIKEANRGDQKLLEKRNNDMKRWVGHAATFKSYVDDLNDAATNVESLPLQQILQLVSRAKELIKLGDKVIRTGTALLNPVPKDMSFWNPTYMSCGSQFVSHNQMPPTQFSPQV